MNREIKEPKIRIKGFSGEWEQRSYESIGDCFSGGTLSHSDIDNKGKYSCVLYGELYTTYDAIIKKIKNRTNKKGNTVKKNDILFPQSTTADAYSMISPACLNESTAETSGVFVIRPYSYIDGNFVTYYTKGNNRQRKKLAKKAQGLTIVHLYYNSIKDETILLPSYEEQHQISNFFVKVDNLISLHQTELNKLYDIRMAMMDEMFPQEGSNIPKIRFDGFNEPWVYFQFDKIFKERHSIDTISVDYPQLSFTIEEGVIRPEDKKTNKRDFLIIDKAKKKYLKTEIDDIIYNPANIIYGAIHRNGLCKGCVSPIYKIFYTNQDARFMECIVRHPRFIKEISRSMEGTVKKLKTLKPKAFLEMGAYIPSTIEEQQKIGEYFQKLDRLIDLEKAELEKIRRIKSACLDKMFV